jgi:hypothetical protein
MFRKTNPSFPDSCTAIVGHICLYVRVLYSHLTYKRQQELGLKTLSSHYCYKTAHSEYMTAKRLKTRVPFVPGDPYSESR